MGDVAIDRDFLNMFHGVIYVTSLSEAQDVVGPRKKRRAICLEWVGGGRGGRGVNLCTITSALIGYRERARSTIG